MKGFAIKDLYESMGAESFCATMKEAIDLGSEGDKDGLKPSDFSIRDLAEGIMGDRWVDTLRSDGFGGDILLSESGGDSAIRQSAFTNITGDILFAKILERYNSPEYMAASLIQNRPTKFSGEKLIGLSLPDDTKTLEVKEGEPYPHTKLGEVYQNTPETKKSGMIMGVTKEAIFFDRTGQLLDRASQIGDLEANRKDRLIWRTILGLDNSYNFNGSALNTYVTTAARKNLLTGNELVDKTQIEAIEALWPKMVDTNGNPITIAGERVVIVMQAYKRTAREIFDASQINTTTSTRVRYNKNYLDPAQIIVSPRAEQELVASGLSAAAASKYMYMGDPGKAFVYMENWPLTITKAAPNSEDEFNRDIIAKFKVSERGIPAVLEPRYMVKSTG